MTLIEPSPSRDFLLGLGGATPRPRAIVAVSAHWEAAMPTVGTSASPGTIHDFYGFPPELYRIRYAAPGDPALAERVAELIAAAGLSVARDPGRGLDHGAWAPLVLAWPAADVPVVPLSLVAGGDAALHLALGRALRPLADEGVLVVGSGNLTHNLHEAIGYLQGRRGDTAWAVAFADWMTDAVLAGDAARLAAWETAAPHARRAHPTPDHLLPLFVAAGAGGPAALLHDAMELGSLSMAAFGFAPPQRTTA